MKFVILGCGSSMGVPRADGFFGNCNPANKKNYRSRCSALIKGDKENILIDTSPDLRQQLIKNKIKNISRVLYTHSHADQTHGINDLRIFFIKNKKPIDVYADFVTSKHLKKTFRYCFYTYSKEYPSILKLNKIKNKMIFKDEKKKIFIKPIKVKHGNIDSLGYIVNQKLAYISDVSEIYQKDFIHLKKINYLIIDCLWYNYHPSHFNLERCLEIIKTLSPKKAILTNLSPILDYNELKKKLPKNVMPAFDGLTINL